MLKDLLLTSWHKQRNRGHRGTAIIMIKRFVTNTGKSREKTLIADDFTFAKHPDIFSFAVKKL
jgi:hypothetical protein